MMFRRAQSGFTMVELLIAMAFFSFLLMTVTVGFVQINRSFTKGVIVKTIQENGRVLIEDISRGIRSSNRSAISYSNDFPFRLNINGVCYIWNQNTSTTGYVRSDERFSNGEPFELARIIGNCSMTPNVINQDEAENLIDKKAVVQHLSVEPLGGGAWSILVVLSTGNSEDLQSYGEDARCREQVGNQYCDVVRYETVVSVRNKL